MDPSNLVSQYEDRKNNYNQFMIPFKNCSEKNFKLENNSQTFKYGELDSEAIEEFLCMDIQQNQTINGRDKLLTVTYMIDFRKTKLDINPLKNIVRLLFPNNIFNGIENYQVLTSIPFTPKGNEWRFFDFIVKEEKHIIDNGIFLAHNTTKKIINYQMVDTISLDVSGTYLEDIFVLTVNIMPQINSKVQYIHRKRLYILLLEMLSMATTLLANFGAIAKILNFEYSKVNFFESIYHINSFENEKDISKAKYEVKNEDHKDNVVIPELNDFKEINYNRNNIIYENNKKKENENFDEKNQINQNNLKNTNILLKWQKSINLNMSMDKEQSNENRENNGVINSNENFVNDQRLVKLESKNEEKKNKEIKNKLEQINQKYPSISNRKVYKKDERFTRNIFDIVFFCFKCQFKKIKNIARLNDIIDREFATSMNIYNFIKMTKRSKIVEDLLFDDANEEKLLDFIALPILNVDKKLNQKDISVDLNIVYDKFIEIEEKSKKTDIQRKLIEFLEENLNKNLI